MSVLELFCNVDDFCQRLEPKWQQFQLENGLRQRKRKTGLSLSEVMTDLTPVYVPVVMLAQLTGIEQGEPGLQLELVGDTLVRCAV